MKIKTLIIALSLFGSHLSLLAQEPLDNDIGVDPSTASKTPPEPPPQSESDSFGFRYFAGGIYSPLDLLIPSKLGAHIGLYGTPDKTWEIEYLRGSVSVPFVVEDLGQMTDQRLSLIRRSYSPKGGFNFHYGLSYFDFNLYLGDSLLNRLTSGSYPHLDVVQIQSIGFNLGLGNRWHFGADKNIYLAVDWLTWSQPLYVIKESSDFIKYASNPNDREDVEDAIDFISYFPRLALLKLQLGLRF